MMTKTDELMELMIQEGERLLDEIDFVNLERAATKRYVEDLEQQVTELESDVQEAEAATVRHSEHIKMILEEANLRDLRGYVGCALMGFIAGALTAWLFLL